MSSVNDTADLFRRELAPYIKPRQEVDYIRKVLALHLQDSIDGPELESPISLVDESSKVTVPPDMTGLYKEYLEALDANLQAIATFQKLRSKLSQPPPVEEPLKRVDMCAITDQIALLKLKQKEARLLVLDRYLDELSEKPAIQGGYLQLNEIFRNSPALPQVPEEILKGVIAGRNSGPNNTVKERLASIDKEILKQKLLLKREEKLLESARSLSPVNPERISEARKRHALNATRNELITWIETELSKASGNGQNGGSRRRSSTASQESITTEKIAVLTQEVKDKYAEYTTLRNNILGTTGKIPVLENPPSLEVATESSGTPSHSPEPISHLMTPYLNQLFELARLKKCIIAHKAHLNTKMTDKSHEARQALDRLAEESQLLPMYPMNTAGNPEEEEYVDASPRVAEWAYAAEAAKLTSLETVAEKLEIGQMALEGSQAVFADIQKVLKPELYNENEADEGQTSVGDIWIEAAKSPNARQHNRKNSKAKEDGWSRIHGKLGLIGQDI